jgi:hypothetical protein
VQRFTVETQLLDRLLHHNLSTRQVEAQHKNVVQVLWLPVQVLVQSVLLQRAVAPPTTS